MDFSNDLVWVDKTSVDKVYDQMNSQLMGADEREGERRGGVVVEEEGEDLHIEDENYDLVPHSSFESWSLLE